jgi:hypothetical protein
MLDGFTNELAQLREDGIKVNLEFTFEQLAMLSGSLFIALVLAMIIAKKI